MVYYALGRDEVNRRQVDPYYLTFFDGGFYLIGYCHWRKTERIFAVERIRELKMLAARFEVRPGFDAEAYLKDAWGIIQGELVTVKVVFSKSVARYVRDRLWHPSQKIGELPDGRLGVTMRVADTLEVRRWILGYGPEAEVIDPASLRESLRQEAAALAAKLGPIRKGLAGAGLDLLAGPRLFATAWPRLCAGYAADALRRAPAKCQVPAPARLLAMLSTCPVEPAPAVGLGAEYRLAGDKLAGAALVAEGRVAHLMAFPVQPAH
jgi:hypothetical protein